MKILVLAYLLQGGPVLKIITIPAKNIQGFMKISSYYNNYPESFKCMVLLKKDDDRGRAYYETTETCVHLQYRYNKIVWGK
jgi:hypothetical protein